MQLQNAKQELKNEEQKYNRLQSKVQSRRQMQEDRRCIQRIIQERSSLLEKQEERMRIAGEHVMARSKFDLGLHEEQRLKRMHVVRKVYSSMLEKKITAEEEDLGSLETTFQQIKIVTGLSDVDDIVQKFKYRSDKTKQLETVAEDVRLAHRGPARGEPPATRQARGDARRLRGHGGQSRDLPRDGQVQLGAR